MELMVLRSIGLGIQVCAADIRRIAHGSGEGNGHGPLGLWARDRRGDPGQDELEDGEGADGLEEHGLARWRSVQI